MNDENDEELFISGPKDYDEQTDSFRMDLENLIYRYIDEYDIIQSQSLEHYKKK